MWKPSCVASNLSSLSFNSGVHTVKYDIALLGLVGVALDMFDCGQATHKSSVWATKQKNENVAGWDCFCSAKFLGWQLFKRHHLAFLVVHVRFEPQSCCLEPFLNDMMLFMNWLQLHRRKSYIFSWSITSLGTRINNETSSHLLHERTRQAVYTTKLYHCKH